MELQGLVKIKPLLSALILSSVCYIGPVSATGGGTISNGTITLGVHNEGNLVVGGVGLVFVPTGNESLADGCACEGWGVADAASARFGAANDSTGYSNIVNESYTSTATSAISVVKIADGTGDFVRVTHDYKPSASPYLYQVDVTIENISGANIADLRYRRVLDWDIQPTAFSEMVTIKTGGATNVLFTSDDGFADGNPLTAPSSINFTGEATDNGPEDHGALFDFGFGALANGGTQTFSIYLGAAVNDVAALAALGVAGAEDVYSLGKPDPSDAAVSADGSPNTFIFGFKGVGGGIIAPVVSQPIPTLSFYGVGLLTLLLGGFSYSRKRSNLKD